MLPKTARKKTIIKDREPFAIKNPAGIKTTSLGNGINELSIVIRIKIPKYPRVPTELSKKFVSPDSKAI